MRTVIVTGGIGSGKSAVCAHLAGKGIPVYDSDSRAKALYEERPALLETLEKAWGVPLREPGGRLDRSRLAALIFSDTARRTELENRLYPALREDFEAWREGFPEAPYVVFESAVVLSKPAFNGLADKVVLVEAPRALRLQRVLGRDGGLPDSVRARMAAQRLPSRRNADSVIRNEGSLEDLFHQSDAVFAHLFDK